MWYKWRYFIEFRPSGRKPVSDVPIYLLYIENYHHSIFIEHQDSHCLFGWIIVKWLVEFDCGIWLVWSSVIVNTRFCLVTDMARAVLSGPPQPYLDDSTTHSSGLSSFVLVLVHHFLYIDSEGWSSCLEPCFVNVLLWVLSERNVRWYVSIDPERPFCMSWVPPTDMFSKIASTGNVV